MNTSKSVVIKERLSNLYDYVQQSLTFVEAKNGALTVLNSAIMIGVLSLYEKGQNEWLYFGFLLPTFVSLIFALLSFYPLKNIKGIKIKKKKKDKSALNETLFNCENISQLSFEELKTQLTEDVEISSFDSHKIEYLYRTAFVIGRKYRLFRLTLISLFLSPIGFFLSYLIDMIIKCMRP